MTEVFERRAWYQAEEAFARQLARGRRTEFVIATRLLPLGLWVRVGSLQERTGLASQDQSLFDQADVEIEGGHILEVKSRDLRFAGPEDYPYETAFVGSVRRWKARPTLPCSIVLFSEVTSVAVVIPAASSARWKTERRYDSQREFEEESYAVPREDLLPWDRLPQHLLNHRHAS